jgi:hypothetical protein
MKKTKRVFKQRKIRKVNTHRKKKKVVGKKNDYKISFLKKKKDFADKWSDIVEREKHYSYDDNGNFSERKFFNILKKKYGINKKIHQLYLNNVADKSDKKIANSIHKERGLSDFKTQSPRIFTKHDFTFDNFFKVPLGWRRLQYKWRMDRITGKRSKFFTEQFYFRCGLKIVYRSKSSGVFIQDENGKQQQVYIMDKVPISSYSFEPFSKGWKVFFNEIKNHVAGFDSIWFFQFLYLDVQII